jgi:hypothetical protein
MTRRGLLTVMGCVVMTGALAAQSSANFSGTWTPDREKTLAAMAALSPQGAPRGNAPSAGGARMGGGGGMVATSGPATPPEWTITQTPSAVTIVRPLPDGTEQKYVYHLSGPSVNANARTTLTTTSHWDGAKLITEGKQVTTTDQGGVEGTFKESRWLDKDGAMHVETSRIINGGSPTTSVQVLAKKAK